MKRIVDQFNLTKWVGQEEAREKLIQAGYRGQAPYVAFLFFRLVSPIVALRGRRCSICSSSWRWTSRRRSSSACASFAAYRRHAAAVVLPQEPDPEAPALDPPRLSRRARPAADLRRIRHVDRGGVPQGQPGDRLAVDPARRGTDADDRRTVLPAGPQGRPTRTSPSAPTSKACRSVCVALQQSERYGTPLGQTLRVMAQENRDMRMSEAEKKAAALPPKLTVPMILFFLPVLFIVILGPAAIRVMAIQ